MKQTIKEYASSKILKKLGKPEMLIFEMTFEHGVGEFLEKDKNYKPFEVHPTERLQKIEVLTGEIVNEVETDFGVDLGYYFASLSCYLESIGKSLCPIE